MMARLQGILVLCVTACLLGGCAVAPSDGPIEIRYWTGWTGRELEVQRELVEEFNGAHPGVRVKILCVAGSYQKIPIAIAGGDTPDVCSAVWADQLYGYAARGALTPLDKYLERHGRSMGEWMPGVRRMLRYHGKTFALSTTANSSIIVYNKRIFRECGLDPGKPPQTLAELERAAEKTTSYDSRGAFKRYGFRPGGLQLWAYVFGGGWYNENDGRITANHPGNVAALQWLQDWARKYDIRKMETFEAGFGSLQASTGAFYTGKTAMWQTGEWAEENIQRYAPHVEWGHFPLPPPPGGRSNCVQLGGSVFVIPAASKHKEEAFEFLSWICGPRACRIFCREINNIPPLIEAAKAPEFQSRSLTHDAIALAGGEHAFGPAPIAIWPLYLREIQRAEDRALHGRDDPRKLLDVVQQRIERELKEAEEYSVY